MGKILRHISGIDNPKGTFYGRLIIGCLFVVYGLLVFWTNLSLAIAFFALGLTFILDGQSILREYFSKNEIRLRKSQKEKQNKVILNIRFLAYFFIFIISILIFLLIIIFLEELVHPLVLAVSFISSAIVMFLYNYFSKKELKGVLWLFSKFFIFSTILLILLVLFFSNYGLVQGVNLEPKNISFDVYVINNAISDEELNSSLGYNNNLWSKYNISMEYSIIKKDINLTSEEIIYLFDEGSTKESCQNYTSILNKILDNSTNRSIIFLENNVSGHAGRGSLCDYKFALVKPEKLWLFDFTGWNVAHEIGHVLGLLDIQYYGRTKVNLMNDEFKKLLIFNPDFLSQYQVDIIIKSIDDKNEQ